MRSLRDSLGRPIFFISMVLAVLGVVIVFSATAAMCASTPDFRHDPMYFFKRQGIFLIVGALAMWAVRKVDLLRWRSLLSLPTMAAALGLLVLVMLVGVEINGARRWFIVGPVQIQIAEFAKLAIIFYLADCLARHRERLDNLWSIWPVLALAGAAVVLIEQEPDLGTSMVVAGTVLGMLFAAGAPVHQLALGVGVAGMAVVFLIAQKAYRVKRLLVFLDPFSDTQDAGYQIYNSLLAVASGGIWGRGVGFSHQKFNYLPEGHTDFVFAILAEEIGFVGCVGLLGLFALLALCGFKLAVNCRRPYLSLLAVGITFGIVFQALLNIAVVTGTVPSTGIPLPFISYGGSSLVVTMVSIGILLNISDYTSRQMVALPEERKEPRRMRRGSTLTSSEEVVRPVSSGEWETSVGAARPEKPRTNLPQPIVEPHLTRRVPFQPGSRAERERLRRRKAREATGEIWR